jgi:SAM-dependent methyltransferase
MNGDPLMASRATVGLLTAAWSDLDRLLSHVADDIAMSQPGAGRASVAWTVAHLANQVDGWINVRFGGVAPHPLLSDRHWRMGSDGSAEDWSSILTAASEVRAAALAHLAGLSEQDLDGLIPYHGSLPTLTGRTISLRYAIARVAAHTYFHVRAMAADLVVAGLSVGDYPGAMEEALPSEAFLRSMQGPSLPSAKQRLEARQLYGADPQGYESGRPEYPERVFDVLTTRCGLLPSAAVLEIGPGTGRVTRRLTAMGAKVTAVEPDHALAAYLRDLLGGAGAEVFENTFEAVRLPEDHFDLAVAAMSFHWVDQDIGLPKLTRVLRPGGWVALWWTLFRDPSRPDSFGAVARDLIEPSAPPGQPDVVPFEIDFAGWRHALAQRAGLVDIDAEMIHWTARLDPEQVRDFYASTIAVRRRPRVEQAWLLDELVERARAEFGGIVERPFVTAIYTGRRPNPTSN